MADVRSMETEALLAEIKRLTEEKAALLAKRNKISFKVSEKGAISVYGLGRFPVTLYQEQMKRFLAEKDNLLAFIAEHEGELSVKAA